MDTKKVVGIIPARYASSRLPGKPMVDIAGKTMIRRVYEQTAQARLPDEVVVATDDERILNEVVSHGGKAMMTSLKHPTGTDRIAEAALKFPDAEIILNVQGDMPLVPPEAIDAVVETMQKEHDVQIVNLVAPISKEEAKDSSVVKTVPDRNGFAFYFSRAQIPFPHSEQECTYYKVADVYAFRPAFLQKLSSLSPTQLELTESVEQLRILEHGYKIKLVVTPHNVPAVNTPEDLQKVRAMLQHHD